MRTETASGTLKGEIMKKQHRTLIVMLVAVVTAALGSLRDLPRRPADARA